MSKETPLKYCKNLEYILTNGDSVDINGLELAKDISVVSSLLGGKGKPNQCNKFINKFCPKP